MRLVRRFSPVALALIVCAASLVAPRVADASARSCASSPYAYAGLIGRQKVGGVRATITAVRAPSVADGHVAGWVGVGGVDAGPNGQSEWIQVGLSGFSGGKSQLYYEVTTPAKGTSYTAVVESVSPGASFAVAVVEIAGRANWWRVEVNGKAVSPAIQLPASHGKWQPVVTSETWNGGTGACNGFSYRFADVGAYHTASWRKLDSPAVLSDRGYGLASRTTSGFVAKSLFAA